MIIGNLREYITIQSPKIIEDAYGSTDKVWVNVSEPKAQVTNYDGKRNRSNGEMILQYQTVFTVWIHCQRVLNDKCRILYDGQLYRITSIVKNIQAKSIRIITELINE